jgi:predicted DNA-binding transcriptional regulator AlpA
MPRALQADDLIDANDVAAAIGLRHRNSVATYLSRYPDFPRPVVVTGGGRCRLWSRSDVNEWLSARKRAGKMRPT